MQVFEQKYLLPNCHVPSFRCGEREPSHHPTFVPHVAHFGDSLITISLIEYFGEPLEAAVAATITFHNRKGVILCGSDRKPLM